MISNINGTREKAYMIVRIIDGPMRNNIGIIEEAKLIHDTIYLYVRIAKHTILLCKPKETSAVELVIVPDSKFYENLQEKAKELGIRI